VGEREERSMEPLRRKITKKRNMALPEVIGPKKYKYRWTTARAVEHRNDNGWKFCRDFMGGKIKQSDLVLMKKKVGNNCHISNTQNDSIEQYLGKACVYGGYDRDYYPANTVFETTIYNPNYKDVDTLKDENQSLKYFDFLKRFKISSIVGSKKETYSQEMKYLKMSDGSDRNRDVIFRKF
jgi:hypothetical protein